MLVRNGHPNPESGKPRPWQAVSTGVPQTGATEPTLDDPSVSGTRPAAEPSETSVGPAPSRCRIPSRCRRGAAERLNGGISGSRHRTAEPLANTARPPTPPSIQSRSQQPAAPAQQLIPMSPAQRLRLSRLDALVDQAQTQISQRPETAKAVAHNAAEQARAQEQSGALSSRLARPVIQRAGRVWNQADLAERNTMAQQQVSQAPQTAKDSAHASAERARALVRDGVLPPSEAQPFIEEAGRIWNRADLTARNNAARELITTRPAQAMQDAHASAERARQLVGEGVLPQQEAQPFIDQAGQIWTEAQRVQSTRPASGSDAEIARFIDQDLAQRGSPLAGRNLGEVFVREGHRRDVDPLVLYAISRHETDHGRLGVGADTHMGVGAWDWDPNNSPYRGPETQIRVGANTFANLREDNGSSSAEPMADQLRAVNGNGHGWATDREWHRGVLHHYEQIQRDFQQFNPAPSAQPASSTAATRSGIPDVSALTTDEKYEVYSSMLESHGGTMDTRPGVRTVLGLRVEDHHTNAYDDRFVVMWTDQSGQRHVEELRGNMESISRYQGRYGVDVNGDGRRDLASLAPGTYRYTFNGQYSGNDSYRPTTTVPVNRDTDGDGRGDTLDPTGALDSILFHQGGVNDTGSAGCQTMPPDVYNRFLEIMGSQRSFNYTLVDVTP